MSKVLRSLLLFPILMLMFSGQGFGQNYCTPSYVNFCSQSSASGQGQTNDVIHSFSTTLGITNITNNNTGCSNQCTGNLTVWPPSQGMYLTVARGQNFRMTVSGEPNSSTGTFQQGYAVWVDWNRNGVFAANELVWSVGPGFGPFTSPLVTVPNAALCGPTRLRVRSQYQTPPTDPCAQYTYGETEDYTVYVVGNPQINEPIVQDTSVCRGQSITLNATLPTATGTIEWFSTINGNTPSSTGPSLVLNNLVYDTIVYVQNADFNCKSRRVSVRVRTGFARDSMLTEDTINLCFGDTATLVSKIRSYASYTPGSKTFTTHISAPACQRIIPDDYIGHPGSFFYAYFSVSGIYPQTLTAGVIQEVGIRINHPNPRELDVWLMSPGGSMIDLTSDNGPNAGNVNSGYGTGATIPTYTYCKFVPTTTAPLVTTATTAAAIANGTYRPEQPFTNLTGLSNGIWRIRVGDDSPSSNTGQFLSGYIKFKLNPADSVTAWSPVYNLIDSIATDSFTVRAFPGVDTTYYFRIQDVPGCISKDSVRVIVNPQPVLTVNVNPGLPACIGTQLQLQATGVDSAQWYATLNPNVFNPAVVIVDSVTAMIDSITAGQTLEVIGISSGGCRDTLQVNLPTYPVPATPTVSVSGPTIFCAGNSVALTSSPSASYLWSTGATTQTIVVTSSGTYWVRAVSQDGCLSDTSQNISITVLSAVSQPAITPSGPTDFCNGGNVTLSAPVSPNFTYLWSNGSTASSITVSIAGTFNVIVTAPGGCSATSSNLTVNVFSLPPAPVINVSGSTVFCQGGSVNLSGPPGLSHYQWMPAPLPDAPVVTITGSNVITLTVEDANGCISPVSTPMNITVFPLPPAPTISALGGISTVCQGNFVTLTGPNGFNYLWSNGSAASSIMVGNSGVFSLQVIDGNGCVSPPSADFNVTVNDLPPQPIITFVTPSTLCDGSTAIMEAPAGYTYLWNTTETTQQITSNANGQFSVVVTDANGCTSLPSNPATVTILDNPSAPSISAGGPVAFCEGGQVLLTAVGVSGIFEWLPGGQTTSQLIVNTQGNYQVRVTDGFGCSSLFSSPFAVTVHPTPAAPQITSSVPGICQGTFTTLNANVTASQYQWSNGAQQQNILVNTPGNYSLVITDNFGCISPPSNAISLQLHPLPPSPAIFATGPLGFCEGNNVTLSGPNGYNYIWSPGNQTTQQITVAQSGMFVLQVIDGNGCVSLASMPVVTQVFPNPPIPVITAQGPTAFCAGESVTLSCNALNVSYQWSNQANTQNIQVQNGGVYSVVVFNSYGCMSAPSVPVPVTVLPLPPPPLVAASDSLLFCTGDSIILTASASAAYLWNTGDTTQSITVTDSGNFYLRVTDANGCTSFSSPIITTGLRPIPLTPLITPSGPTDFCIGGSVILSSNYTQGNIWSNGLQSQHITVQNSGLYFTIFTDSHGCSSDTSNKINITVADIPPVPNLLSSGSTAFCRGQGIKLWIDIPGTYSWSTGSANDTITVEEPGLYEVQVMDVCSTYHQLNVNVTVFENPIIKILASDTVGCFPFTTSFSAVGSGYSQLSWNLGNGFQSSGTSPTAVYEQEGEYAVSLTATSSQGCVKQVNRPSLIKVYQKPEAAFTSSTNQVKLSEAKLFFVDLSLDAVAWKWIFAGRDTLYQQHPTYAFADTGLFTVRLIVTSDMGCTDTTEETIDVQGDLIIYIPNAFTPNNDQLNNLFCPVGTFIDKEEYTFRIFDRWGKVIFFSNKPGEGWNGLYNESEAPEGVYSYQLICRDLAGKKHNRKGSVTLIR